MSATLRGSIRKVAKSETTAMVRQHDLTRPTGPIPVDVLRQVELAHLNRRQREIESNNIAAIGLLKVQQVVADAGGHLMQTLNRGLDEDRQVQRERWEQIVQIVRATSQLKRKKLPPLSATNSESEPFRLVRLERVFELAVTHFSHYLGSGNRELLREEARQRLLSEVVKLHDHKGELTVRWNCEPNVCAVASFELAWVDVGEAEGQVRHVDLATEGVA